MIPQWAAWDKTDALSLHGTLPPLATEMPTGEWVWAHNAQRVVILMITFKARLSLTVLLSSPLFAYVLWAVLQVILQMKPQVHHVVLAGHPCRARGMLPLKWECDCTCSSSSTKLWCAHSLAGWLHKSSNKHFSKIKMRTGDCLEEAEWTLMLFWEKQRK